MPKVDVTFREAKKEDLPVLVSMLADDPLGTTREEVASPLHADYLAAFEAIRGSEHHHLMVVEQVHHGIVGMLQLSLLPNLSHKGAWRCLIEGVRIHRNYRGKGLGQQMFQWAIDFARSKGCRMVQLTTDKKRPDALSFYERLGFEATHIGLKMKL